MSRASRARESLPRAGRPLAVLAVAAAVAVLLLLLVVGGRAEGAVEQEPAAEQAVAVEMLPEPDSAAQEQRVLEIMREAWKEQMRAELRARKERAAAEELPKPRAAQNPADAPPPSLSDLKPAKAAPPPEAPIAVDAGADEDGTARAVHAADAAADAAAAAGMPQMAATTAAGVVRVQRDLRTIAKPVAVFGAEGEAEGEFRMPWRVLELPDGRLLVSDTGNHRLQLWTVDGVFQRTVGGEGDALGELMRPRDLALAANGSVVVVDHFNHRLQVFDAATLEARSALPVTEVMTAAVAPSGEVVLFETHWNQLRVYSAEGKFLHKLRLAGVTLADVAGITFGRAGELYLADAASHRVVVATLEGEVVREFGKEGTGAGELDHPYQVAVAPDGNLFVVEYGNHRVQVFSPEGRYLYMWGSHGAGVGEFTFPTGVAVTRDYKVVVCDSINARVQVF